MLPTWGTATFINPATLFAAGEQGAWYDPSDNTTMFQDAAGTTPVTAVEQAVGRILDKSGRGNHATQSTSASRPTLRARYNLLTYSEQFDNAAWTKDLLNTTGTPAWINVAVAPDGTTTADKIIPNTTNNYHIIKSSTITVTSGVTYTASVYAKAGEISKFELSCSVTLPAATFDLVAKTAVGNVGSIATITDVGNGWFRCVATRVAPSSNTDSVWIIPYNTAGTTIFFAGNGTDGILVWGAQLVPTAVFPSNVYQRIAASTDYATGPQFPQYLAFDGTDDSLLTASVDFTGTDKMTVWAGVTKNSDATTQILTELSAVVDTNNGSFAVGSLSGSGNYFSALRGTALAYYIETTFAAPITNVLSTAYNIGGAAIATEIVPRVNGTTPTLAATGTDAGTGNFGNYPLYIGRRTNAAFPFNGRIYSLIVRGAASNTTQVAQTEKWVASKTPLWSVP